MLSEEIAKSTENSGELEYGGRPWYDGIEAPIEWGILALCIVCTLLMIVGFTLIFLRERDYTRDKAPPVPPPSAMCASEPVYDTVRSLPAEVWRQFQFLEDEWDSGASFSTCGSSSGPGDGYGRAEAYGGQGGQMEMRELTSARDAEWSFSYPGPNWDLPRHHSPGRLPPGVVYAKVLPMAPRRAPLDSPLPTPPPPRKSFPLPPLMEDDGYVPPDSLRGSPPPPLPSYPPPELDSPLPSPRDGDFLPPPPPTVPLEHPRLARIRAMSLPDTSVDDLDLPPVDPPPLPPRNGEDTPPRASIYLSEPLCAISEVEEIAVTYLEPRAVRREADQPEKPRNLEKMEMAQDDDEESLWDKVMRQKEEARLLIEAEKDRFQMVTHSHLEESCHSDWEANMSSSDADFYPVFDEEGVVNEGFSPAETRPQQPPTTNEDDFAFNCHGNDADSVQVIPNVDKQIAPNSDVNTIFKRENQESHNLSKRLEAGLHQTEYFI